MINLDCERTVRVSDNEVSYAQSIINCKPLLQMHRSYREMERRFKVYVYNEGEVPIAHDGPCKNIYAIEGRFIAEMENNARFRTTDGEKAHVYFMPFSVTWMVKYLYKPDSHDQNPLRNYVRNYVELILHRYPFWNRTTGADHFMVACHDWVTLFLSMSRYFYALCSFFGMVCCYINKCCFQCTRKKKKISG